MHYEVTSKGRKRTIRSVVTSRSPFKNCYECGNTITKGEQCGRAQQGLSTVWFCMSCLGDPISEEETTDDNNE